MAVCIAIIGKDVRQFLVYRRITLIFEVPSMSIEYEIEIAEFTAVHSHIGFG